MLFISGNSFWPVRLLSIPHPENRVPVWEISLALIVLVGITAAAFVFGKKAPYFVTGWLWILSCSGEFDRRMAGTRRSLHVFSPRIGLYIAATWAVTDLTRSWRFQRIPLRRCCP